MKLCVNTQERLSSRIFMGGVVCLTLQHKLIGLLSLEVVHARVLIYCTDMVSCLTKPYVQLASKF